MLHPQLDGLTEGLTSVQYAQYCRQEGYDEETVNTPYPHPYLLIWLETIRHADPMTGTPSYPDPSRGYLEQDADLTLACAICDAYREELAKLDEQRKQVADLVKQQGW